MADWLRPELVLLLLTAPCVGSFLGVLVVRLPAGKPLVLGRSACPHCGVVLKARDLVPLASWLASHGRCRTCGARLGLFYPLIELLALAVALWAYALVPGWPLWATCLLGWMLLALALIDARHLELPDGLTLPLIPAGLLVAWLLAPEQILAHVIGAAAGFLFLAGLALLYRRLRGREGIGLGDAKLLAAAGAGLGWQGLPSVILIAAAGGLAGALLQARLGREGTRRLDAKRPLPFGPYLAAGFWLVWLYGPLTLG